MLQDRRLTGDNGLLQGIILLDNILSEKKASVKRGEECSSTRKNTTVLILLYGYQPHAGIPLPDDSFSPAEFGEKNEKATLSIPSYCDLELFLLYI